MTEHDMQLLAEKHDGMRSYADPPCSCEFCREYSAEPVQDEVQLSGANVDDREPVTPRPIPSLNTIRHALAKALPESIPATDRRPLESGRRAHR